MAYLGLQPDTSFRKLSKQTITGNGGATYTLNYPVNNASELEVYVNNVRQEPEVAYTVLNQTLTMTDNVLATDSFYVVYQGQAIGTLRIPEKDNSDNYNFDNGLLYLDAANNRVGIGTTSTFYKLTSVYPTNNTAVTDYAFVGGSDTYQMIGLSENTSANEFAITNKYSSGGIITFRTGTGGTIAERMRIDSSGLVGIGKTPSYFKLDVEGSGRFVQTDTTGTTGSISLRQASGNTYPSYIQFVNYEATVQNGWISCDQNQVMRFATGLAERIRIDNSGNIGIATSSPLSRLDVRGGNGTGGISGPTSNTWAARIVMNQDNSTFNGLSVHARWNAASIAILEAAIGWDGSSAGYYPVFRVDGAGQVTMPYQPAFISYGTSGGTSYNGTVTLPFNTTTYNQGGHYNTGTYRFTAPITGLYFFSLSFLNYPGASTGYITAWLSVNGSGYTTSHPMARGTLADQTTIDCQGYIRLSAGDYVEPKVSGTSSYYTSTGHAHFSGHLIG